MTKLSPWNTAELLEIVSTPSPSHLHCHGSNLPSSLGFHHKLLELASSLFQSLLHTTTRLYFINTNQIVIPLHKTQQRLSFFLGMKSRILTLTSEGLCDLLLSCSRFSRLFTSTLVAAAVLDVSLFPYHVSA